MFNVSDIETVYYFLNSQKINKIIINIINDNKYH